MSATPKVKKKATSKANTQLPTLHPHAAGIDIGAAEIHVAVPCDADPDPIRTFATFTDDLHVLRDWLLQCRVKTVATEGRARLQNTNITACHLFFGSRSMRTFAASCIS